MAGEEPASIRYDDFVGAVHGDPASPESRKLITGFVGRGGEDGRLRVYSDASLSHYVEIGADDVVHAMPIADSPLGGSHLWIKGDATVTPGPMPVPNDPPGHQPAGGLGGAGQFNPYLTAATTCTLPQACNVGAPPAHPTALCVTHDAACFPTHNVICQTHNVICQPTLNSFCQPTHFCEAQFGAPAALTHVVNCMVTVHCAAGAAPTAGFGCPSTSTCTPPTLGFGCPNTSTCTPQTHMPGCPNTSTCTPPTHLLGCPNTSTCTPQGLNGGIPHTAGFVCVPTVGGCPPHQTTATLCTQVGCPVATPTTTVMPTFACPTHFCATLAGCPTLPNQGGFQQQAAFAIPQTHMAGCPNTSTCTPQTHAPGCPNTSTCAPQTHAMGCPNTSTCTPQTHAMGCPNTSTCTPQTYGVGCPNTVSCPPIG